MERVLQTFEAEQQIVQQKSNKNRIITVVNWSKYQSGCDNVAQSASARVRERMEEFVDTNLYAQLGQDGLLEEVVDTIATAADKNKHIESLVFRRDMPQRVGNTVAALDRKKSVSNRRKYITTVFESEVMV